MFDRSLRNTSLLAAVLCSGLFGGGDALALTYNVGMGTLLVDVSMPKNDPAPDDLVCAGNPTDGGVCGDVKDKDTPVATFYQTVDINSAALAKYDVPGKEPGGWEPALDTTNFGITLDSDQKSGTWTQTVVPGALLTHYVAVKTGPRWSLFEILLPAVVSAGDVISGLWTTNSVFLENKELSHLSLYNSLPGPPGQPPEVIPLPAALPLFATALGGLGLLGWRRRRKSAA